MPVSFLVMLNSGIVYTYTAHIGSGNFLAGTWGRAIFHVQEVQYPPKPPKPPNVHVYTDAHNEHVDLLPCMQDDAGYDARVKEISDYQCSLD